MRQAGGYNALMSRFDETEAAVAHRLRALRAKPDMKINLLDIIEPLGADGFMPGEIQAVLRAFEQDKAVALSGANRMVVLKAFS
jgi:hypothetical protein